LSDLRAEPRTHGRDDLELVRTQTGRMAWQANRHSAVRALSRDPRLSDFDPMLVKAAEAAVPAGDEHEDSLGWSKVLRTAFTPERVDGLRSRIEEIAGELLDAIGSGVRPPDLHGQFSVPLVRDVTCALIGVPGEDGHRFRVWWEAVKTGTRSEAAAGQAALLKYVRQLIAARRADRRDDFVSALVAAEHLSPTYADRTVKFLAGLVSKGRETPVNAIDWGVVLLLRDPSAWDRVVADRRLLSSAVEELLRLFPVISGKIQGPEGIRRFALTDFESASSTVRRGDLMLLNVVAANMDTEVFGEPERFDIGRDPNPHLTFGFGPHSCPAAHLAKLELLVAFGSLLDRFPGLRLAVDAAELRFKERPTSEGFESLPVTW
jgi:pentalenolactone synthase